MDLAPPQATACPSASDIAGLSDQELGKALNATFGTASLVEGLLLDELAARQERERALFLEDSFVADELALA